MPIQDRALVCAAGLARGSCHPLWLPKRQNRHGHQQDAAQYQFVYRIVEGPAVTTPVVDVTPLAGGQQCLLLGLSAAGVRLAPVVEDVPRR